MIVETGLERFAYHCGRCDLRWESDFEVRHATGATGGSTTLYTRFGLPCLAPPAAHTLCGRCGCGPVHVKSLGRPDARPTAASLGPAADPHPAATSLAERVRRALRDRDVTTIADLFAGVRWPSATPQLTTAGDDVVLDPAGRRLRLGREARGGEVIECEGLIVVCFTALARPVGYPLYLALVERHSRIVAAQLCGDARDALSLLDPERAKPSGPRGVRR